MTPSGIVDVVAHRCPTPCCSTRGFQYRAGVCEFCQRPLVAVTG